MPLPTLDVRRHRERAALYRLLISYESVLEAHMARVLRDIGKHAARAYRDGRQIDVLPIRRALARVLRPCLFATARAFADRLQSHPKSRYAFASRAYLGERDQIRLVFERKAYEDLDQTIRDYMDEHTAELVVGISDTTRDRIAGIIIRGQEDGKSVEDIAQDIVDQTAGEIGLSRARTIARTETHAAAMYGQQATAEASPLDWRKVWLATEDHRTRPTHAEANGQAVALDQPFEVGDAELMYPGDMDGPAKEVINCRCVALYEPVPIGEEQ